MAVMPSTASPLHFHRRHRIIVEAGYDPDHVEGRGGAAVLAIRDPDKRQRIIGHLQEACFEPSDPIGSFNLAIELQRTSLDRTDVLGGTVLWWPDVEWPEPLADADR